MEDERYEGDISQVFLVRIVRIHMRYSACIVLCIEKVFRIWRELGSSSAIKSSMVPLPLRVAIYHTTATPSVHATPKASALIEFMPYFTGMSDTASS